MNLNFFRPRFDPATNYSYRWCEDVISKALEKGIKHVEYGEDEATRVNLENSISDSNAFAFYDHGSEKHLFSQNWEIAVDENNYDIFSGKPIYLLACLFGAEGAQKTVDAGAPVIWAYNRPFGFFGHMEDYFKEQANVGLNNLLEGSDFAGARRAFLKRCEEIVKELDQQGLSMIADQILYNMDSLVVIGDNTVKLSEEGEEDEKDLITVLKNFLKEMKNHFEKMGKSIDTLLEEIEGISP